MDQALAFHMPLGEKCKLIKACISALENDTRPIYKKKSLLRVLGKYKWHMRHICDHLDWLWESTIPREIDITRLKDVIGIGAMDVYYYHRILEIEDHSHVHELLMQTFIELYKSWADSRDDIVSIAKSCCGMTPQAKAKVAQKELNALLKALVNTTLTRKELGL